MIPSSFAILHGGHGLEMTLLEYLYRVLLYLLAFGGTAVLAFGGLGVAKAVRSAFPGERGGEENER